MFEADPMRPLAKVGKPAKQRAPKPRQGRRTTDRPGPDANGADRTGRSMNSRLIIIFR